MNTSLLKAFVNRFSERTKLIVVGLLAFTVGTMFGGRHGGESNGRYVPWGANGGALLDTQTGQIWTLDAEANRFKKGASLPSWNFF